MIAHYFVGAIIWKICHTINNKILGQSNIALYFLLLTFT